MPSCAVPSVINEEEVTQGVFRVNRLPPFSRIIVRVALFDYGLQAWCSWGPAIEFRTLASAIVKRKWVRRL